jgi:hypothetical protein
MARSPGDRTVAIRQPPRFLEPAIQMLATPGQDHLVPRADRVFYIYTK